MAGVYGRVFVYYPRGTRTGGPEALHQLVHHLRAIEVDATLVPLPGMEHVPRVREYDKYDAPEVSRIEDAPGNAVIVPESAISTLRRVRSAERIIWWLSIDNAMPFLPTQERLDRKFTARLGVPHVPWAPSAKVAIERHVMAAMPMGEILRSSKHLAQSAYARAYIQTHYGMAGTFVTDYIPRSTTGEREAHTPRSKSIAFNPKKAPWVPDLLGPLLPGVEWHRLEGLSAEGVADMLRRSAVYFDPGYHPGRDRMPREAALNGAVTMVARRGAGAYWGDVPIADQFKVTSSRDFATDAAGRIAAVLRDVSSAVEAQEGYLNWILDDEKRFAQEVRRAFIEGRWEDDSPLTGAN